MSYLTTAIKAIETINTKEATIKELWEILELANLYLGGEFTKASKAQMKTCVEGLQADFCTEEENPFTQFDALVERRAYLQEA